VFHRLLVVVDRSEAAAGAHRLARDWARTFGAEARFVALDERPARVADGAAPLVAGTGSARLTAEGHTLGARNRSLVGGIAAAAEKFGADLIVLGCDHRRLARHRFGPSLRERLARATELPVIVAPAHPRRREDGHDHAEAGRIPGHRMGAGRLARV
jgi:nucleotide-binding universal stress UspA family protein